MGSSRKLPSGKGNGKTFSRLPELLLRQVPAQRDSILVQSCKHNAVHHSFKLLIKSFRHVLVSYAMNMGRVQPKSVQMKLGLCYHLHHSILMYALSERPPLFGGDTTGTLRMNGAQGSIR